MSMENAYSIERYASMLNSDCGKRSFHWDKTVGDVIVGNAHTTDNKSQGVCRRRSFYWETRVQDRYFIPTDGFRLDCVWRPTGYLTFEDICVTLCE